MPESDMRRMQEEAARRAREMQSRARQSRPRSSPAQQQDGGAAEVQPSPDPLPEPAALPSPPAEIAAATGETPPSLLEELFKDRERTILLALLLLLGAENGNNELMFALLFLLM